jgi:glycosyltransferase involved in cell wall biosynthesis
MQFDVVALTTAHSATDDRIFYREAKTLAAAGLSICVVGRHPTSEVLDGIYIHALQTPRNRFSRLLMGIHVLRITRRIRGKMYIFHDPELFAVGLILSMLGNKVVYDSHENVPKQVLQKPWIPLPVRYAIFPFVWAAEWLAAHLISGVIAAVPVIQRRFPRRRTILVRNFPPRMATEIMSSGVPIAARPDIAIYAGGLSRLRGIAEVVNAFAGLEKAELWLVGKFSDPSFEEEIRQTAAPNVKCLGWKEFPEVLKLYNSAKIGIVTLYPEPNHRNSLPVKLFEYLGAGLPVVISNFPEFSEYSEGCGIQVDPYSVDQVREAARRLFSLDHSVLDQMSAVARDRARRLYCWEPEGERLVSFCCKLIARPPAVKALDFAQPNSRHVS